MSFCVFKLLSVIPTQFAYAVALIFFNLIKCLIIIFKLVLNIKIFNIFL